MDKPKTRVAVPSALARNLRLMKDLSQADAAERYGVSAALISLIENGGRSGEVFADYILALAEAPSKRDRTPGGELRVGARRASCP